MPDPHPSPDAPTPEVDVASGRPRFWDRVATRSRTLFREGVRSMGDPLGDAYYEELEELLVAGDLGPAQAGRLAQAVRAWKPVDATQVLAALEEAVVRMLSQQPRSLDLGHSPAVVLFYGINGAGKTTTVAKLAASLKAQGRRPLVAAADTFRAAGVEQLLHWAEVAGVEAVGGRQGGDAAAVVFDAIQAAAARHCDTVLIDTAGRLQTQHNLMEELRKVHRVTGRALAGAPHESLLVLDAALGQNSLSQARAFREGLGVTGLVLAKMDGTAKGGAVVAIESEMGVPAKLIGLGEGLQDLYAFDPRWFARSLFGA